MNGGLQRLEFRVEHVLIRINRDLILEENVTGVKGTGGDSQTKRQFERESGILDEFRVWVRLRPNRFATILMFPMQWHERWHATSFCSWLAHLLHGLAMIDGPIWLKRRATRCQTFRHV